MISSVKVRSFFDKSSASYHFLASASYRWLAPNGNRALLNREASTIF